MESADFFYLKLRDSFGSSENQLHKVSMSLVSSLKAKIGAETDTQNGPKRYFQHLIPLIETAICKFDPDCQATLDNLEALVFLLSVVIRMVSNKGISHFLPRLLNVLKFSLQVKTESLIRFTILTSERILLSRSLEELTNLTDLAVDFAVEELFPFLGLNNSSIRETMLKTFSKVLKTPSFSQNSEYNFTKKLANFLCSSLKGVNPDSALNPGENKRVTSALMADCLLKSTAGLIQFMPSWTKDIIFCLLEIISIENPTVLLNIFLCLEVGFATCRLSEEVSAMIFNRLLEYNVVLNLQQKEERLVLAYIKCTVQVLNNLLKKNLKEGLRHLNSLISVFGEYFQSGSDFLNSNIFTNLNNILRFAFTVENHKKLMKKLSFDISDIELDETEKFNLDEIINSLTRTHISLVGERFADAFKYTFGLLFTFVHLISRFLAGQDAVELILQTLSEEYLFYGKNEDFRMFIIKCFNEISPSTLTALFPLELLNIELETPDYELHSKCWIVSYLPRYLRKQYTVREFFDTFGDSFEDLRQLILNWDQDEDQMDERFEISGNKEIKAIKKRRYELMFAQLWMIFEHFTLLSDEEGNVFEQEFVATFQNLITDINFYFNFFIIRRSFFIVFYKMVQAGSSCPIVIELLSKISGQLSNELVLLVTKEASTATISEMKSILNLIKTITEINGPGFLTELVVSQVKNIETASVYQDRVSNKGNAVESSKKIDLIIYLVKETPLDVQLPNYLLVFINENFDDKHNVSKKKLMDLFLVIIDKIKGSQIDNSIELIMQFYANGGFKHATNKQKIKALEVLMESLTEKGDITTMGDIYNLIEELVLLTKEINKKTRNSAYELIGKLAGNSICYGKIESLIDLVGSALTSQRPELRAAALQSLARILWESKDQPHLNKSMKLLEISLTLFDDTSKEVVKSAFLLVRVFLFMHQNPYDVTQMITNKVFNMRDDLKREFKVKIRNLLKSLILKVGYEEVSALVPSEDRKLIHYINKFLVNKSKKDNYEAEVFAEDLNDVSMLGTLGDLNKDEEEHFIENEFKKTEKRGHKDEELKVIKNLTGLNVDGILKKEKEEKKKELFGVFDDADDKFSNHLYVNPFVKEKQKEKKQEKDDEDGVYFNEKSGKLIVKDMKLGKKRKREGDDEDEGEEQIIKRKTKNTGKAIHNVKFSGSEYKSKKGQGDRLIKGKYEPFAYIQLNPKAALKRTSETPREFVDIMKRTAKKGGK